MKKIIILFLLFFAQLNFSQELLMEFEVITSPDENSPKFEGGSVLKFYEFIKKEFNLNKITKAGTITTSFNIATDGNLKNIRLIGYPDIDAAMEMINVLNKSPKWQPATRAGKPFEVNIKLPVKFNYIQNPKNVYDKNLSTGDKKNSNDTIKKHFIKGNPAENKH